MDQLEPVKNKQDSWEWGGAESLAFSQRVNFLLSVHSPGRLTVTLLEMHRDTAVHNFHYARCGRTHPVGTDTGLFLQRANLTPISKWSHLLLATLSLNKTYFSEGHESGHLKSGESNYIINHSMENKTEEAVWYRRVRRVSFEF